MGTSTSKRAPQQPRWGAFIAALSSGQEVDRVRSELFNASGQWQDELSSPAVASFAAELVRLHGELSERLSASERTDTLLGSVISEARNASAQEGYSAAGAIAERAFARLLLATIQGGADDPSVAAARWESARGSQRELVAKYVGEMLGQYARHVTDREAGRLISQRLGATASARLSDELAQQAISIGSTTASAELRGTGNVAAAWERIVARSFEVGSALPRDDS